LINPIRSVAEVGELTTWQKKLALRKNKPSPKIQQKRSLQNRD
jgi:hypothetical protein